MQEKYYFIIYARKLVNAHPSANPNIVQMDKILTIIFVKVQSSSSTIIKLEKKKSNEYEYDLSTFKLGEKKNEVIIMIMNNERGVDFI